MLPKDKVALSTWFSYHNYGTALQVTALYHLLSELGKDVDVVNYIPVGKCINRPDYKGVGPYFCELISKAFNKVFNRSYTPASREKLFDAFLDEHLSFTAECLIQPDFERLNDYYDIFVCGSDQIWNPAFYNSRYFFDYVSDNRKKVSYAPSVGNSKVDDEDVARCMKKLCSRFDALSTREESGSKIVSELTGRDVETVIDPTLLMSSSDWNSLTGEAVAPSEPYLLAYMLGYNKEHWKRVYELASLLDLPVRIIPVFKRDLKRGGCITDPVGPAEFVSLIANASYVCTDSFHGVAFSINLNCDFCVFERFKRGASGSQNSRIYNILDKMSLQARLALDGVSNEELVNKIEWTEPNNLLLAQREHSLNWLKNALALEPSFDNVKNSIKKNRSLCCGCGACEVACPVDAISMKLDEEGFWRANVNEDKCVSCGKCRKACPLIHHENALPVEKGKLYSFKTQDVSQLMHSSSGGAGAAIAAAASSDGAYVLGCAYEDGRGAVGKLVSPGDSEGLSSLAGSKYTQEEVRDELKHAADCGGQLFVFGAPCQIQAARNLFSGHDDVTYVDFVCHGVPSRHLLSRYSDWLNRCYGLDPQKLHVNFRYKPRGWRERYIYTSDGSSESCRSQHEDPYFLLFEAGQCYGQSCYECPWRATSAADLRMADYWGPRFSKDETGVSMLLALTERGEKIIADLRQVGAVSEQPFSDYNKYQQTKNFRMPVFRDVLIDALSNPSSNIQDISDQFALPVAQERKAMRRLNPLKEIAKKILKRG